MVTAQNAKLLTSYREEIKSNRLDQKYKYYGQQRKVGPI